MKIFISWSGELSKNISQTLNDWLPSVIQLTKPFVSTDIPKGSQWFSRLMKELEDTKFGIFCLTPYNLNEPWLLFEAGAIAKKFDTMGSYVSTLLIGELSNSDLSQPLSNFQSTILNDKSDMLKLFKDINNLLEERKIETKILESTFEMWWKPYKEKIDNVINTTSPPKKHVEKKSERKLLEEILEAVRSNAKFDSRLEDQLISINDRIEREFFRRANKSSMMTLQNMEHDRPIDPNIGGFWRKPMKMAEARSESEEDS